MSEPLPDFIINCITAISAIDREDFKNSGLNKGPPRGVIRAVSRYYIWLT
jgi:hypothetical protein